jgi:hypothetical protein
LRGDHILHQFIYFTITAFRLLISSILTDLDLIVGATTVVVVLCD